MDIVERLRNGDTTVKINSDGSIKYIKDEAADEIERLREALRQAQCNCEEPCLHGQWCSSWIAFNALKEKE